MLDEIICANFGVEKLRGLGNTSGQILEFSIEMAGRPYKRAGATAQPVISYRVVIVESTAISDQQCQHYDSKVYRRMHQNDNPFVLRRFDGRIKKCRGCKVAFKGATARPKFVISHQELCVYGRIKDTKQLLTT